MPTICAALQCAKAGDAASSQGSVCAKACFLLWLLRAFLPNTVFLWRFAGRFFINTRRHATLLLRTYSYSPKSFAFLFALEYSSTIMAGRLMPRRTVVLIPL